jgi:hypothetical protein
MVRQIQGALTHEDEMLFLLFGFDLLYWMCSGKRWLLWLEWQKKEGMPLM